MVEVNNIFKVTDLTFTFICTALFNILEITRGKHMLLSNPSQKLRLVFVIKNLEPEVFQPGCMQPSVVSRERKQ